MEWVSSARATPENSALAAVACRAEQLADVRRACGQRLQERAPPENVRRVGGDVGELEEQLGQSGRLVRAVPLEQTAEAAASSKREASPVTATSCCRATRRRSLVITFARKRTQTERRRHELCNSFVQYNSGIPERRHEAECELRRELFGRRRLRSGARGSAGVLSDGRQLRLGAPHEAQAVERERDEERGGHQEDAEAAQSGTHGTRGTKRFELQAVGSPNESRKLLCSALVSRTEQRVRIICCTVQHCTSGNFNFVDRRGEECNAHAVPSRV